jgi:hypothetical protein
MTEEQEKLEGEIDQIHHQNDRKQQMMKSKLYVLLSAFSVGKELQVDRDTATIDDLYKHLQELAHNSHS